MYVTGITNRIACRPYHQSRTCVHYPVMAISSRRLAEPDADESGSAPSASSAGVYLDCNATAPIDPEVRAEVWQYLTEEYGNAGSRTHQYGQAARNRVQQ